MDKRLELKKISKKRMNNPFIKERNSKKFRKKCLYCLIFGSFFLIFAIYLVFFTKTFAIKTIHINELKRIDCADIRFLAEDQAFGGRGGPFSQKNIIFFNKSKLLQSLEEYNFAKIDIKKSYFSKINIEIKEREVAYILEEGGTLYYLDNQSNLVFKSEVCPPVNDNNADLVVSENLPITTDEIIDDVVKAIDKEREEKEIIEREKECLRLKEEVFKNNYYPVIKNIEKDSLFNDATKKAKISAEYIRFAIQILNDLGIEDDFGVKKFIMDNSRDTVNAQLYNNVIVIFNLKGDLDDLIKRFSILRDDRKDELRGVEYIDIRYGDKIYYR